MFDNLTNRLSSVVQSLKGSGRLTDKNIKDTLRQIRLALLEADVSLPVVKEFISNISEKVVGTKFDKVSVKKPREIASDVVIIAFPTF